MNTKADKQNKNNFPLIIWLCSVLLSVLIMTIIGGLTRLTDSGLSMVEWRPLLGFFPPLNDNEWDRVFNLYQNSPEYIFYNSNITLQEFKSIFYWEYFHRLWGRFIGIIFVIPFLIFWIKKLIPENYKIKLILILFLGLNQALVGWWMVQSGLIEDPNVSQYRLALHLSNALLIMFCLIWIILDLIEGPAKIKLNYGLFCLFILTITIIAGAFVAGMDAGLMYNTYPLMNERFLPDQYGALGFLDPLENPGSAQFHHRHLGLVTLLTILFFYLRDYKRSKINFRIKLLIVLTLSQFTLGIFTLLNYVPIASASLHQTCAIIMFLLLISIIHKLNKEI